MLEIKGLSVAFKMSQEFVPVTRDISFNLSAGETLGIVGESGSGKSVTSMALMGLLPKQHSRIRAEALRFEGKDLLAQTDSEWRNLRGKDISMIFQDPMTSLNPLMTCGEQIAETMRLHQRLTHSQAKLATLELLEQMGIPDPQKRYRTYPFELSGGMRQRIMIAIALSCRPKLLIADEPTTALDVTIQAQILNLIRDAQKKYGMALILITHDLGIIQDTVNRVMVMYAGNIVEQGATHKILNHPTHPYTHGLMQSIPKLKGHVKRLHSIEGVVPRPDDFIAGCRFHPRCEFKKDLCLANTPQLMGDDFQSAACLRKGEWDAKLI